MLTNPTLDQMAALGLTGMADAWKALNDQDANQDLDRNEWLGLMLDREATYRADKRFANRLRNAKMRFPNACIEDIDFRASRGLDRQPGPVARPGRLDQGPRTDRSHRPIRHRKNVAVLCLCAPGRAP